MPTRSSPVTKERTRQRNQLTGIMGVQEMNIQDSHDKAGNMSHWSVTYNLQGMWQLLTKGCTSSIPINNTHDLSRQVTDYKLNFYRKALLCIRSKDRLLLTSKSPIII